MNERQKKLLETLKQFNKEQKDEILSFGNESEEKEVIPTGIKTFDKFIGGGTKQGTFTIIYGGQSVGKSTLVLQAIAKAQKEEKICCYVDLEHTFDKERALSLGVNLEELILAEKCSNAEQALEIIRRLCKEKVVDLIVIDSVQAMSPKAEQESKKGKERALEEKEIAELARVMSKFFKVVAPDVFRAKASVIMIGQVRIAGIGSFYTHATMTGGECFDINTRILTENGFKKYNEVKIGDKIPTINLKNKCIEMKPIKNVYIYNYKHEKLLQFKDKYGREFLFTPNHKCLVKKFTWDNIIKNSKLNLPFYKIINACDERRTYAFPVCFPSGNKDYSISDDELRLIGWLLTDGTVLKADKRKNNWKKYSNRLLIYQSKENYLKEIEKLLIKLNLKYTKTRRKRKDKRFSNRTFISYTFNIHNAKFLIKKYKLNSKKELPKWVNKLSDRQVSILIKEMFKGDGSKRGHLYKYICDGRKKNLETIQSICATHNIPVSKIVKSKSKKCWYLYFRKVDYVGFSSSNQIKCKDKVWDISVDNELHFIERNGQIIATHNSLKHWAYTRCFIRRGQRSDAPVSKFKEYFIDPDGKVRYSTQKKEIGFDSVIKLEKTKSSKSSQEGDEIHIPFIYDKGFVNEVIEPEDIPIRIDAKNEEEKKKIEDYLEEKDIKIKIDKVKKGKPSICDEVLEDAPKIKKRGRPRKEKKNESK